jgi:hypothetical protein
LVQRIEQTNPQARMPKYRPEIPASRRRFIREWIEADCPHNGEVGIVRERDPRREPAEIPTLPVGPFSFETDIKPLFRENPDRRVMLRMGLDLHDFGQVSGRADVILSRLQAGDMPCDGAWPPQRIAIFQAWIDGGKQP